MYFFIHGGRGAFQKNYSDEGGGGHAKKIGNWGGVIQFSNYTPPNSTSPPYPIKNERSLRMLNLSATFNTAGLCIFIVIHIFFYIQL